MFKLIQPMPSPKGTNFEKLFVSAPERVQMAYDAMPRSFRRAHDAEEEGGGESTKLSAKTVVGICDLLTKAGMPVDEVDDLRAALGQYCDEDMSGAGGEDQENDPDGNPPPGGLELRREREEQRAMDQAMKRRLQRERDQRALALDSRAAAGFAERHPWANHIKNV